jgi:hypothetical protein
MIDKVYCDAEPDASDTNSIADGNKVLGEPQSGRQIVN